jgi:hypothetical protein
MGATILPGATDFRAAMVSASAMVLPSAMVLAPATFLPSAMVLAPTMFLPSAMILAPATFLAGATFCTYFSVLKCLIIFSFCTLIKYAPGKLGSGKPPTLPTHSRPLRQPRGGNPTHPARGRQPRAWRHGKPIRQQWSRLSHPRRGELLNTSRTECAQTQEQATQLDGGGCQSDASEKVQVESLTTDPEAGNGTIHHSCGLRRQLVQFLKDGSEYFTPEEVRQVIRAERLGAKGSLNAIGMLEEDMQLLMHEFPDAKKGELREQIWDEICYKECRKLLQLEAGQIKDISEDRGTEEIPVLVDLEVQHWIAEALEGTTHTSELVEDRINQIGVQCTTRGRKRSQNESGDPSPVARKARQAVLDAARGDPLRDSQLERVVRLTLGKRAPVGVKTNKAVVACVMTAKAGRRRCTSDPWSSLRVCSYSPAQAEVGTRGRDRESSPGICRSKGAATSSGRCTECTGGTATGGCAGVTCGTNNTTREHSSIEWCSSQTQEEEGKDQSGRDIHWRGHRGLTEGGVAGCQARRQDATGGRAAQKGSGYWP